MKTIDQTPFYNENGGLSLMDRGRAIMQFGSAWLREVEAQKPVISVLEVALDNKFTLLRNVTPPGLDTMIPLILVGPTGVYVMSVVHQPGTFTARGDQWGSLSGGSPRPEKPNLLIRTERMGRAIQVFLEQQGVTGLNGVEAALLCPNPTTTVDSVRPIIRVVMCDAFERFAVSIAQARLVLNPESVFNIVNRLLNPPATPHPEPPVPAAAVKEKAASQLPDSTYPGSESASAYEALSAPPIWNDQPVEPPMVIPHSEPSIEPPVEPRIEPPVRRRWIMTSRQWAFVLIMAVVLGLLVVVLAFLVVRDFLPQITMF
jgi:hypothetical protein